MPSLLEIGTGGYFTDGTTVNYTVKYISPQLSVTGNSTGTSLTVSVNPPTNSQYSHSSLHWRLRGEANKDNITTNSVVSGNYTIESLQEDSVYEIWAHSILDDGGVVPDFVSNMLVLSPSSGSIREKILDRLTIVISELLLSEVPTIRLSQVRQGHRHFDGKYRGMYGVVLLDCSNVEVEAYTTSARRVHYFVDIHVGWLDKRAIQVENNLGNLAESIVEQLDQVIDPNIPELINVYVRNVPFESDAFDHEHMRGFSLQVDYQIQEAIC
jgi:hypothetical protein